ncbi:hypothetical protein Lalb_Chr11g0061461 [Lupinus albus]|uniref:Uncharacterized protein n=1 Tax=Lupinus albus TaxID=3870 RepID=A0A6A4PPR4_LUPAL|nr:hypothetical protein Lalb_Chr11g0061461 [Lupinus albus]
MLNFIVIWRLTYILQKTQKVLALKIEELNSAIDDVSAQLREQDAPNGVPVNSEVQAAT